jgi:hypothetical protein
MMVFGPLVALWVKFEHGLSDLGLSYLRNEVFLNIVFTMGGFAQRFG